MSILLLIVLLSTVLFFLLTQSRVRTPSSATLPPGPPGLPVLGNVFQLTKDLWVPFTKWKEEYGPIIHVNILGQPLIILSSHKVAADLLDRKAAIYSDRPRNIVASEMMCGGMLVSLARYGHMWRRLRRAAHEGLQKTELDRFTPYQTREAVLLTSVLLSNPSSWVEHVKRSTTSMIMSVTYDRPTILNENDVYINQIENFVKWIVTAAYPGAYLVEFLPWMRHLPTWIAPWKKHALKCHMDDTATFMGLYRDVKLHVGHGDERPSLCASLIQHKDHYGLSEKESAWLCAMMYAGGSDTVATALQWFLLAMVLHPQYQAHAQQELDHVVGRSRMPTLDDVDSLPYVNAILKETQRWRPMAPLGMPHVSTEDDWYEGYFIPKGSLCMANVWALNHDTKVYGPKAEEFNPERFLDEEGKLMSHHQTRTTSTTRPMALDGGYALAGMLPTTRS